MRTKLAPGAAAHKIGGAFLRLTAVLIAALAVHMIARVLWWYGPGAYEIELTARRYPYEDLGIPYLSFYRAENMDYVAMHVFGLLFTILAAYVIGGLGAWVVKGSSTFTVPRFCTNPRCHRAQHVQERNTRSTTRRVARVVKRPTK